MRLARVLPVFALMAGALGAARDARANGRFPFAQYVVVGPGARSDVIVLRATFGLLTSLDGGATFHWSCEEALGFMGTWDAPVAIGADGTLSVGRPDGLVQTLDGCGYAVNASAGALTVLDLAADASGRTILGAQAAVGVTNHILRSDDDGASFAALGVGVPDASFDTVEIAPSNALRVYATATDEATNTPRLYRSDDGGATLMLVATSFLGGTDAYVSAVDPTNPDRLWLRSNMGARTGLLRSDDAGASFVLAATTTGPMQGFALSDDGARVWIGGTDQGLLRSDDGGATFHMVWTDPIACLRYHAGVLFACTDWTSTGEALWRWPDGAAAPVPLLALAATEGPFACAAGTIEHDTCGARWPAQQVMVTTHARDAGGPDGATTDAAAADATGGFDATEQENGSDAGAAAPRTGCACRAMHPVRTKSGAFAWISVALLAYRARRRSARRNTQSS